MGLLMKTPWRSGDSKRSGSRARARLSGISLYLVWAIVAACVTSSAPPAVAPTSTVGPLRDAGRGGEESRFALAFSAPSGSVQTSSQVSLVFNKPLRVLSADERPPALPITL